VIRIAPLSLPDPRVSSLAARATEEGFDFLNRLEADWTSGANRFDQTGEILLAVTDGASLLAVGGLNVDPYDTSGFGRLRRVYVVPEHRAAGIGRALVAALLDHARPTFQSVRLRAGTNDAGKFYDCLGFRRVDAAEATHAITLD
jgi:GNAT superfamily N-acetyltransferase